MKKRIVLAVFATVLVGSIAWGSFKLYQGISKDKYKDFPVALQVITLVHQRFIEPVGFARLAKTYYRTGDINKTLVDLGDPYTRYLTPAEYREFRSQTEGRFGGIGVYLDYSNGYLKVMRPMKGSPASNAGILQGDRIVAVDGRATADRTLEQVVSWIKGKVGTAVTITIERGDEEHLTRRDVEMVRAIIKVPTVEMELLQDDLIGTIAMINVAQFAETTADDLENAMAQAERAGIGGIVLDLRYNPGGLLTSAIEVASKFLPDNVRVVRVEQRGYAGEDYPALPNAHPRIPLVVLVNEWSASASEIVAGAIQDYNVGILVGNTTFGKGVVQDVIPLVNGGAMTLTVARYLTAGGRSIHKKGIQPQVLIPTPEEVDKAMKKGDLTPLRDFDKSMQDKAVEVLRQSLLGIQQKKAS